MVVEYTKEELLILEKFKDRDVNTKVRNLYKFANSLAKERFKNPTPFYKTVIQHAKDKFKKMNGSSAYSEDDFVLMELKSCVLYFQMKYERFYGSEGWKNFNSPTEVLGGSIPILVFKWNHRNVEFNVKETLSKKYYEVDQYWRDHFHNVPCLIDFQGKITHENNKKFDGEKFKELNQHTRFIQIDGTTLVNNYAGVCHLVYKYIKPFLSK